MLNLIVFAPGNGTTLQAIIDAISQKKLDAKINLVVSNHPEAYALIRAKNAGIETYRIKNKTWEEQDTELMKSIIKAKLELDIATKNFEQADDELIDYYTYQIKANQAKLDYLLKKVKHKSLALDMIEEIKLRMYENEAI